MQCCKDSGVKNSCLGICTFNLDLDFLLFDSECIPEFDKAMACGSGNLQINSKYHDISGPLLGFWNCN